LNNSGLFFEGLEAALLPGRPEYMNLEGLLREGLIMYYKTLSYVLQNPDRCPFPWKASKFSLAGL
jgi:hypothetical protein